MRCRRCGWPVMRERRVKPGCWLHSDAAGRARFARRMRMQLHGADCRRSKPCATRALATSQLGPAPAWLAWANRGRQLRLRSGSKCASSATCRHQVDTPPTVWHLRGRRARQLASDGTRAGYAAWPASRERAHGRVAVQAAIRYGTGRSQLVAVGFSRRRRRRQHTAACRRRHKLANALQSPWHLSLSGRRENISCNSSLGAEPHDTTLPSSWDIMAALPDSCMHSRARELEV